MGKNQWKTLSKTGRRRAYQEKEKQNKRKQQLEGYIIPFLLRFLFAGRYLPFSTLQHGRKLLLVSSTFCPAAVPTSHSVNPWAADTSQVEMEDLSQRGFIYHRPLKHCLLVAARRILLLPLKKQADKKHPNPKTFPFGIWLSLYHILGK